MSSPRSCSTASALDLDDAALECAALHEALPETAVLVLVARAVEGTRDALLQAGAAGVVLRGPSLRELVCAVHQVHRGGTFVSEALIRDPEPAGGVLSPRQAAVLGLIAQGLTTKAIAARLQLGTETIDTHVEAVLRKLHAANRPHAVFIAVSQGLL
jgi:DNA-binding NarL/FixJ family response regulator